MHDTIMHPLRTRQERNERFIRRSEAQQLQINNIFSKQQGRYTPIFKNKMALCANGSTCIDDDEVDDED